MKALILESDGKSNQLAFTDIPRPTIKPEGQQLSEISKLIDAGHINPWWIKSIHLTKPSRLSPI